jgi:hypothetical protein
LIGETAASERAGESAIQLERRVVIGDRLVEIALQPPDIAAIAKQGARSRSPA